MKVLVLLIFTFVSVLAFAVGESVQFTGQRINKRDISTYKKFNLKSGDVIITYNGKPLKSAASAMELYNLMGSGGVSSLLIERKSKYQFINIK